MYKSTRSDELANPTVNGTVIKALDAISKAGFSHKEQSIVNLVAEFGPEDPAFLLLATAASMADEDFGVGAKKHESSGMHILQFHFNKSMDKPPVRSIRAKLDTLKQDLLFSCIRKAPDGSGYIVEEKVNTPLNVLYFVQAFTDPAHPAIGYYRMPKHTMYETKDGKLHSGLVTKDIIARYYADLGTPEKTAELYPERLKIDNVTMARLMEELDMSPQKGHALS